MRSLLQYGFLQLITVSFAAGMILFGCEEELPDVEIPQFNHPQDVALVCYDSQLKALPLDACRNSERSDAEIFAFVTQTQYGEVAIVSLEDYEIVDQEKRIPFNSFVPVGGQPQDITASSDGAYVYTANFETRDISVINVQQVLENNNVGLQPARSVNVSYPAAQIVVSSDVGVGENDDSAMLDKFAFVTQPTVGRIAVVNLEEYYAAGTRVRPGVLAYLRMDDATLSEGEDPRPEGVAPWSMVASQQTASLYVGGNKGGLNGGGSYILEIQREILIDRAKRSYESTGEVLELDPAEMVVRRMDLNEFTVRDMSIEPELERWMYIVENEKGGVIVLDLESGELVEINAWDITATDMYSMELPGIAKKVKLARFSETLPEGEKPEPLTFNGTIALISTTRATLFVADVSIDDDFTDDIANYSSYSHSLRSSTLWYEDPEDDEDDDGEQDMIYPEVGDDVQLIGDEDHLSYDDPFAPLTTVSDSDIDSVAIAAANCSGDQTDFRMVQTEDTQNVYFRCDRRMSVRDTWQLMYQGLLDISGVGILKDASTASNFIDLKDEYKDFCSAGLLGPAGDDLWGVYPKPVDTDSSVDTEPAADTDTAVDPADLDDVHSDPAGLFARFRGYPGDIVEITSDPAPFIPETDCSAWEDEDKRSWYQVVGIVDSNTVRLAAFPDTSLYAPLPTKECFGEVLTYQVRARDSWVLTGQATGFLSEGSMVNGQCVPWRDETSNGWNSGRVFEGAIFENLYLKFYLNEVIDLGRDLTKDSFDVLGFIFETINGFTPMGVTIGQDITDIEVAPNNNIVIIDQSSKGMILFDLLDTFKPVDDPIN
ncbi:MAG: hypothetical protein JXX29_11405 [Deltaproteobacteria bacterium]|nr:hypothetical protein [Deltaproteobacteria bacterium]MBN2672278.1 hypothetical protein [Deltaproteobacteria bacterium]